MSSTQSVKLLMHVIGYQELKFSENNEIHWFLPSLHNFGEAIPVEEFNILRIIGKITS